MNRILKKLIVPSIIVVLFALVYLIVIPYVQRRTAKEQVFTALEKNLKTFNISYKKSELSSTEFGAWKAYQYTTEDDLKVKLYVFNKDSKEYDQGVQDGRIISKKDKDTYLYAKFYGHCGIYVDEGFPHESELLSFMVITASNYENKS